MANTPSISVPDDLAAKLIGKNKLMLQAAATTYQQALGTVTTYLANLAHNVEHGFGDQLPNQLSGELALARFGIVVNELVPTLRAIAAQNRADVLAGARAEPKTTE